MFGNSLRIFNTDLETEFASSFNDIIRIFDISKADTIL